MLPIEWTTQLFKSNLEYALLLLIRQSVCTYMALAEVLEEAISPHLQGSMNLTASVHNSYAADVWTFIMRSWLRLSLCNGRAWEGESWMLVAALVEKINNTRYGRLDRIGLHIFVYIYMIWCRQYRVYILWQVVVFYMICTLHCSAQY